MSDIRSSWEIAQDRIRNIGELSAEERRKQKEARLLALGKGAAEKYISTADTAILEEELLKYPPAERAHFKKAVMQHLIHSIDLHNSNTAWMLASAISKLTDAPGAAAIIEQITTCISNYQQAEEAGRLCINQEGMDILNRRALSGTAVKTFNSSARIQWENSLERIAEPYKEKMESLKKQLSEL